MPRNPVSQLANLSTNSKRDGGTRPRLLVANFPSWLTFTGRLQWISKVQFNSASRFMWTMRFGHARTASRFLITSPGHARAVLRFAFITEARKIPAPKIYCRETRGCSPSFVKTFKFYTALGFASLRRASSTSVIYLSDDQSALFIHGGTYLYIVARRSYFDTPFIIT